MNKITSHHRMVETYTIEFEEKVYYRVEILEAITEGLIETPHFFAEVYMLRWPNGQLSGPAGPRSDNRYRQFWLFLDDFPFVSGASVEEVLRDISNSLQSYTTAYLNEFETRLKRARIAL